MHLLKMAQTILYYDGFCVLCNKSIRFIINRDRKNQFKIGFLNSLKKQDKHDSVVLVHKGIKYQYSTAVIKSLILLGGIYKLTALLFIFPKSLRDFVYKMIARNRYKWFGRHNTCPTLPEKWKARLIDHKQGKEI
ncbi:MAG: thiol-disulfide oxidoreductase [Bacteroidetes bacterium MED-G21]|nr:MAG: thiol-disulfide oxidoreductase [Bacteroidetes bacterium MED-G21]